jgi:serine/threonine protein kinase
MNDDQAVWSLALSISDGQAVDWERVDEMATSEDSRDLIRFLRIASDIAMLHQGAPGLAIDAEVDPAAGDIANAREFANEGAVSPTDSSEKDYPTLWAHLRIQGRVGRGSFGQVYRAWDTTLDREVALKLLDIERLSLDAKSDETGSYVLKEGHHLARIRHSNVVTVYGAGKHDSQIGLWMEFIEGHTLEDLLVTQGRYGAREAAMIGLDLCRALSAVHSAGLVHRDIKAKNVMREDGGRIVLMDFGAGGELRAETRSLVSTITGTPMYMAPEVLRGEPPTPRSDIYSLGTLLFRLVAKSYPFEASTVTELRAAQERCEAKLLRDVRPDLPEAFVRLVDKALAPEPSSRFSSAGQMEQALEAALNLVTHTTTPGWIHTLRRWMFRHRRALAVGAVGVAAAVVLVSSAGQTARFRRLLFWRPAAETGWIANGSPLCTIAGGHSRPSIAADSERGAIIAWQDTRNGNIDIFAQRVDATGRPLWEPNGVPVCIASEAQLFRNDGALRLQLVPSIVSDGAGGAIIAWHDHRGDTFDICAQHITASGGIASGWPVDGQGVCTSPGYQVDPVIVSDGAGGAIIAWRSGSGDSTGQVYDIYAERITAAGRIAPGWPAAGLPVCTAAGDQQALTMISDASGGAILTWSDYRSGVSSVYSQRVTATGAIAVGWPANGVALCSAVGAQEAPVAVADGDGGALVTWEDLRSGNYDIYAQHITASGRIAAGCDRAGVGICVYAIHDERIPTIAADGSGGAIITWYDWRHFCQQGRTCADIFAQRVSAAGVVLWLKNGVPMCSTSGDEMFPRITADGAGGAIIAWRDSRNTVPPFYDTPGAGDIYVQRTDSTGKALWAANGVPISTAPGDQTAQTIVSDGRGGAYIAWQDGRSGKSDVYVNHITDAGTAATASDSHR